MNKLIVDKENIITIENKAIDLEIKKEKLTINIIGKVLINDLLANKNDLNITINLTSGSELVYNNFKKGKINHQITLNQEKNSTIIYNYGVLATDKSFLKIDANIQGNNNSCEINVKVVTKELGSIKVIATGDIAKNVLNNKYLENIRILCDNQEENTIIPNLFVNSNNIEALHNATISSIASDELFYLNSKGISDDLAKELIMQGFLINNLKLSEEGKMLIINKL